MVDATVTPAFPKLCSMQVVPFGDDALLFACGGHLLLSVTHLFIAFASTRRLLASKAPPLRLGIG